MTTYWMTGKTGTKAPLKYTEYKVNVQVPNSNYNWVIYTQINSKLWTFKNSKTAHRQFMKTSNEIDRNQILSNPWHTILSSITHHSNSLDTQPSRKNSKIKQFYTIKKMKCKKVKEIKDFLSKEKEFSQTRLSTRKEWITRKKKYQS